MKLIAGLGNPGTEYDNTKHNIGFAVLDSFGEKYKITGKQEDKFLCWYGKGKLNSHEIMLVWPTTFMNHSGDSIAKLMNYFKIDIKDLIVVHDEVAIDLGKIRVAFNNSSAGHHGVESIIQGLGENQEFSRVRIGVGPDPGGDLRADYVLKKFKEEDTELIKKVIALSVEALETIITKDVGEAMNKYNGIEIKQ